MAEHRQEQCVTPKITWRYKYGDLWICGTCGRVWTLTNGQASDRWELTDLRSTHVDRRPGALPPRPTTPPPTPPPSSGATPNRVRAAYINSSRPWTDYEAIESRFMMEEAPWEISEADDKKITAVYDDGEHTFAKHMATCVDAATAAHIVRVHNNSNPQGVE